MLRQYSRMIFRDRRRLLLAVVLNLLAARFGDGLLPDPLPAVSSETLVVLGFLTLAPVLTFRYRDARHWVEIFSLGNVVVTLHGDLFPGGIFGWHDPLTLLFLQIPAYFGLLIALKMLVYGRWSDRMTPRRRVVVTAQFRTLVALSDLWFGMVPTPGFAEHNPDREVVSVQFADSTRRVVRLVTWLPPRPGTGEVLIRYDEIVPLRYVRFRLRITRGTHDPDAEGDTELFFEDRGDHRILRLRHRVNGFTPRRILMGYLDDTFGRVMAARLDAIEARAAGTAGAKTRVPMNQWFDGGASLVPVADPAPSGYRTAYGRARSDDETRALEALGRL